MPRKNKPDHGSLFEVGGNYYVKIKWPGSDRRGTYALQTRSRSIAIARVNDMYDKAKKATENKEGDDPPPTEMTLKKYTDKFIDMRKYELAVNTIESYKTTIKYALHFFGDSCKINAITPMMAQEFKSALISGKLKGAMKGCKGLCRISVDSQMKQIRAVFYFAVKKLKILSSNPFSGMVDNVKQSKRWHYVTPEETQALLDASTQKMICLIALCRLAALRRLEAYYLTWQDVNFDKNVLHVVGDAHWQPKGRESRVIPICPELQKILLEAFERANEKTSRVCTLKYPGNIRRNVIATIKRAGVNVWASAVHTLRKSCITDWAKEWPMHVVKEWAGHCDIKTTAEFYLQVTPDQYSRAAEQSLWGNKTELCHPAEKEKEKKALQ